MGSGQIAKAVAMVGIVILVTFSFTGTPQAWEDMGDRLEEGIDLPDFVNSFDEVIRKEFALANTPSEMDFTSPSSPTFTFVGCENTTTDRVKCLNGSNESAYIQIESNGGTGHARLSFNFTNPLFNYIDPTTIRSARLSLSCRTVTNTTAFPVGMQASIGDVVDPNQYAQIVGCPSRQQFVRHEIEYTGIESFLVVSHTGGMSTSATLRVSIFFPYSLDVNYPPSGTIMQMNHVDFYIAFAQDAGGCQAPDGAWFPWVDEVACAIGRFGDFVWKGIQFVINAGSYLLVSVATTIVFIGHVIVDVFFGVAQLYGSLFSIGAPTPAQEIIDIIAIASIAFLVISVVQIIRGGEG